MRISDWSSDVCSSDLICAMLGATVLLYALFAPVGRHVARMAALLSVIGIATLAASGLPAMAPLVLLDGAPYPGIGMAQTYSLVELALLLRDQVRSEEHTSELQ